MEVEEEAHSSITKEAPKDAPKVEVKRWDLACSLSPILLPNGLNHMLLSEHFPASRRL